MSARIIQALHDKAFMGALFYSEAKHVAENLLIARPDLVPEDIMRVFYDEDDVLQVEVRNRSIQ